MKKQLYLLIILLSNTVVIYAQELRNNSTIKAKHYTFIAIGVGHDYMSILNDKNVYHTRKASNSKFYIGIEKGVNLAVMNTFKQVFSNERLQQLLSEPGINISYYVSPSGKVLELSFLLSQKTLITAAELETLEDAIKNNVTFKLTGKIEKKDSSFYVLTQYVRFDKILDGTFAN